MKMTFQEGLVKTKEGMKKAACDKDNSIGFQLSIDAWRLFMWPATFYLEL